ncbi:Hyaluronan / mRNA binding family [Rhynchospora pubera]|uniref:Hyaluronan / mRNA binding family n=1 Tax=Rhynchospora pubera TaxID=906938 RepID=A0AAV8G0J8_9POAL|nr:Hyaluronan / mRNA binding family [Rhynchospora pubera]
MATLNPFDLLEDVESDDPSQLIAATEKKIAAKKAAAPAAAAPAPTSGAKLPTKPLPPAQAVKEAKNNSAPARGGRGGAGRGGGGGRGGRGYGDRDRPYRDFSNTNGYSRGPDNAATENGTVAAGTEESAGGERGPRGPRGPYRGGPRRGGYGDGEAGEEGRPRRTFDRHSGTGRSYGMKKDGAGRANWGTSTDENPADKETEENVNAEEKTAEKEVQGDVPPADEAGKEKEGEAADEAEKEKEEDKEMTLEEYEKIREEKRKALLALKAEERKVEVDKDLQKMQVLSLKKNNDEVFIKLGADKESKKKESAEEKAKKSLSINEFLKPADGENFYGRSRGRGGGRGRGDRGNFRDNGGRNRGPAAAPSIADQNQFPSLGGGK